MKCKKIISVLLLLAFTMLCVYHPEIKSQASLEDKIKDQESQIGQAAEEKKKLQAGLTDIEKILKSLEESKSNLANYVQQLDKSLNQIAANLTTLMDQLEKKEAEIVLTKEELLEAEETERKQYESMKARIQFIYEKGDTFYLETILSAKSFSDFVNKSDYVAMLSEYDRKMLDEYEATRIAIEQLKASLEEEQKLLAETKQKVQNEQDAMETLIASKEQEIKVYEGDIQNKEVLIQEYRDEIAAQEAAIKALEAAVAADKAKLAAQNAQRYDGGKFAWPAPSFVRISSEYGTRLDPFLGIEKFHNGVDLSAPAGSPILAAYSGKVVQATYSPSMGNYIFIDHGDGLFTIYMHASALHVSAGQSVARGERIASVGTTGRSTGNHLHFSVRLNGNYVSPWNYISK